MLHRLLIGSVVLSLIAHVSVNAARADSADLRIEPAGLSEEQADAMIRLVLAREDVARRLNGPRVRVLRADFGDAAAMAEGAGKDLRAAGAGRFRLEAYDYERDEFFVVTGDLDSRGPAQVRESHDSAELPEATPVEFDEAVKIIRADPRFATAAGEPAWNPYEAMPGLVHVPGRARQPRVITVGIMPDAGARFAHEIVGVNLSQGEVIRYPTGAPPTAIARPQACAPTSAYQYVTGRGTSGAANVTVTRGGNEVWRFRVVRPAASSGAWGSGIDLRNIYYRGKRVLSQAHTPVLNVLYNGNVCGPYRDWMYSENAFNAQGTAITSGILKASSPPQTIFETGSDRGNYRGVAIYDSGTEVVLTTEVSAGWYRYKSEWRFKDDGTIEPRWGFSAVQDSCTCYTHHHHAYWRFDFDVGATNVNRVQYYSGTQWNNIGIESKFRRDATHQLWRVMDHATGSGYLITPGANDESADAYARGDVWALRYNSYQLDDSSVYRGTAINIDAFLTGQSVTDQDLVVWYGAGFLHTHEESRESLDLRGPTLTPINW
jgi:hypothetical protein